MFISSYFDILVLPNCVPIGEIKIIDHILREHFLANKTYSAWDYFLIRERQLLGSWLIVKTIFSRVNMSKKKPFFNYFRKISELFYLNKNGFY